MTRSFSPAAAADLNQAYTRISRVIDTQLPVLRELADANGVETAVGRYFGMLQKYDATEMRALAAVALARLALETR